ncbi:MAG: SDR family NAD(P)-dependent oxidoreductase, partial [Planctomycetota bacterium]
TNFFGALRCTQAALPLLRQAVRKPVSRQRAVVVMVSSFVGRRGLPLMSAYCASKFALEALSESLRVELHDEGIAVAVVNPGVTRTEFFAAATGTRPAINLAPHKGMSPEAVAQALLSAARHPCRNRYLTLAGKSGMVLQWLAPSVFDYLLIRSRHNQD